VRQLSLYGSILTVFRIGDPYQYHGPLSDKQFKRIEVNYRAHLDAFTVITARVPDGWKDGPIVGAP
jgi:hypothetical protein